MNPSPKVTKENLREVIHNILWSTDLKLPDVHTHLFTPAAEGLWLSGIVKLLMYHYAYREHLGWRGDVKAEQFFSTEEQTAAEQVWRTHFSRGKNREINVLPISEGMRAILTILKAFNLDLKDLQGAIEFFKKQDPYEHTDNVLKFAGISTVVGTNNPFDPAELNFYNSGKDWHPAFSSALRLDTLVLYPTDAFKHMRDQGFHNADVNLSEVSIAHSRKFINQWITGGKLPRVKYVGISFPPDFPWCNGHDLRVKVLEKIVIPACVESGISLFLMPEPVRQLEPTMRNAGDFLGKMDSVAFGNFAQGHPEVDMWVSPLNLASQYEMSALCCVLPHVKPWSTWWYQHQPSITREITSMRLQMHGSNSLLFNSDARVLEHLISKWWHAKQELAPCFEAEIGRLIELDYEITSEDIRTWIKTLFDERRLCRKEWNQVLKKNYNS